MGEPLEKELRRKLETVISQAREAAEKACRNAVLHLGVDRPQAESYLSDEEKALRHKLRAHGLSLGDVRKPSGEQEIESLVTECAYEQWHRMLFARFLAESKLLIHPELGISVSLDECEQLAKDEGFRSKWDVAGRFASAILPQVFRADSPALALSLAKEDIVGLEGMLESLVSDIFQASDSLGWVYQFWQSKKKEEVNASEVKIGADELPSVTQLFTEPYMVSFLLDNSLGAWWAGKRLSPDHLKTAENEQSLRRAAELPGLPLSYLRFVNEGGGWKAAAGKFNAWPRQAKDLKVLDPSCGSGHFLVAVFEALVAIRMEEEGLSARDACDAVLRDNIYGLELDPRCVEIAAFALAFAAWRYPDSGGYRELPRLHVACSGLPVKGTEEDWIALGGRNKNLGITLGWMHKEFRDAPVLGSLIRPTEAKYGSLTNWSDVTSALNRALESEQTEEQHNLGIMAQGLAAAAEILASRFHLVITNVPYLARGKQSERLRDFCKDNYSEAKNDLATVFLDRCLQFCEAGGSVSIVLPQNWLFLTTYKKFREKLLKRDRWHLIARLGPGAFETISGEVVKAILITMSSEISASMHGGLFAEPTFMRKIRGLDVSEPRTAAEKAALLLTDEIKSVEQAKQLENPDARIAFDLNVSTSLLSTVADYGKGSTTGDSPRFLLCHWEFPSIADNHILWLNSPSSGMSWSGRTQICKEPLDSTALTSQLGCWLRGQSVWGRSGVAVNKMRSLEPFFYSGEVFDDNICPLCPKEPSFIPALWAYVSSDSYHVAVRKIDQKLNVTAATLVKVPFDLEYWSKVAAEKYPDGLPEPYSDDPTQWIFHGHPAQSTAPLQVAVARLAGYKWPAESDTEMELSDEARAWIRKAQELDTYADNDGIVCLPSLKGEGTAAERLETLLRAAYGQGFDLSELMRKEGYADWPLEEYLRNQFFEDHCKIFQHRPFVWQVWDGHKDGFSALVNYHKLNAATLDRLIYSYLNDYIHRLEAGKESIDDAETKLVHAKKLKEKLELIKEGEKPYDIFVRWKPLSEQPLGWNPDLNDGVRLNIRPWMTAEVLRHNKAPKLNIKWNKDRGKDVESAPWYSVFKGDRINDHHTTLAEKRAARENT